MTRIIMYVVHSAYPDSSWRGQEKCMGANVVHLSKPGGHLPSPDITGGPSGLLLYGTAEEAREVIAALDPEGHNHWSIWPIPVEFPDVRETRKSWQPDPEEWGSFPAVEMTDLPQSEAEAQKTVRVSRNCPRCLHG